MLKVVVTGNPAFLARCGRLRRKSTIKAEMSTSCIAIIAAYAVFEQLRVTAFSGLEFTYRCIEWFVAMLNEKLFRFRFPGERHEGENLRTEGSSVPRDASETHRARQNHG